MENQVYKGQFIRVTEEDINKTVFERVYIQDSITIFAFDDNLDLIFVKENRPHETPAFRWKPVTGFFESDTDISGNANRELQEEIGKKAKIIIPFFEIVHTGTINIRQYFVIAKELTDSKLPNPDGEDSIVSIRTVPLQEAVNSALEGDLAKGATAYGLLKLHLELERGIIKL